MSQSKQPTVIPRWWYLIFFVGAIALFITGGALFGSCTYYAALACFVVAVIFKLIAWTLLILHCIQRRRYNQQQFASTYHTIPPMDLNQQPYGAYYAPPPGNQYSTQYSPHYSSQAPPYATAPTYPNPAYHGQKDVNSQPSSDTQTPAHYA
ncbi:uncharacterized protein N7458_001517 [Penicillium daleae]|uniref:Uncharacterized protein n=1 Tax=Penicillium daleae TaxID=63821 RepID=A0AAD6CDN0_9EURO|nr:uncharacterized protein N7458_001517 [Penicillium daleae]KAJ5459965.1 hypothetical protein N7458_001517 [Penicillium daleae]